MFGSVCQSCCIIGLVSPMYIFSPSIGSRQKVSLPPINVLIVSFCFTFSENDIKLLLVAKILWSNMSSFVEHLSCHEHAFTP